MKTVLDLGAYDGSASREYVEEGDRWILVDNHQYIEYDWSHPKLPKGVEYHKMDIMDYHEPADIVVCSNVIYHMEDPFKFLHHLRKLTKGKLILNTYLSGGEEPEWKYIYGTEEAHPHLKTANTIYYRPTRAALYEALEEAGFTIESKYEHDGGAQVKVFCV